MTPSQVYWLVSAFLLIPVLPIVYSCVLLGSTREHRAFRWSVVALVIQCVSLATVTATLIRSSFIGQDYSQRRYVTIWVMLAISALTTITAKWDTKIRTPLVLAGAYLTADWLYFAAVSSVV